MSLEHAGIDLDELFEESDRQKYADEAQSSTRRGLESADIVILETKLDSAVADGDTNALLGILEITNHLIEASPRKVIGAESEERDVAKPAPSTDIAASDESAVAATAAAFFGSSGTGVLSATEQEVSAAVVEGVEMLRSLRGEHSSPKAIFSLAEVADGEFAGSGHAATVQRLPGEDDWEFSRRVRKLGEAKQWAGLAAGLSQEGLQTVLLLDNTEKKYVVPPATTSVAPRSFDDAGNTKAVPTAASSPASCPFTTAIVLETPKSSVTLAACVDEENSNFVSCSSATPPAVVTPSPSSSPSPSWLACGRDNSERSKINETSVLGAMHSPRKRAFMGMLSGAVSLEKDEQTADPAEELVKTCVLSPTLAAAAEATPLPEPMIATDAISTWKDGRSGGDRESGVCSGGADRLRPAVTPEGARAQEEEEEEEVEVAIAACDTSLPTTPPRGWEESAVLDQTEPDIGVAESTDDGASSASMPLDDDGGGDDGVPPSRAQATATSCKTPDDDCTRDESKVPSDESARVGMSLLSAAQKLPPASSEGKKQKKKRLPPPPRSSSSRPRSASEERSGHGKGKGNSKGIVKAVSFSDSCGRSDDNTSAAGGARFEPFFSLTTTSPQQKQTTTTRATTTATTTPSPLASSSSSSSLSLRRAAASLALARTSPVKKQQPHSSPPSPPLLQPNGVSDSMRVTLPFHDRGDGDSASSESPAPSSPAAVAAPTTPVDDNVYTTVVAAGDNVDTSSLPSPASSRNECETLEVKLARVEKESAWKLQGILLQGSAVKGSSSGAMAKTVSLLQSVERAEDGDGRPVALALAGLFSPNRADKKEDESDGNERAERQDGEGNKGPACGMFDDVDDATETSLELEAMLLATAAEEPAKEEKKGDDEDDAVDTTAANDDDDGDTASVTTSSSPSSSSVATVRPFSSYFSPSSLSPASSSSSSVVSVPAVTSFPPSSPPESSRGGSSSGVLSLDPSLADQGQPTAVAPAPAEPSPQVSPKFLCLDEWFEQASSKAALAFDAYENEYDPCNPRLGDNLRRGGGSLVATFVDVGEAERLAQELLPQFLENAELNLRRLHEQKKLARFKRKPLGNSPASFFYSPPNAKASANNSPNSTSSISSSSSSSSSSSPPSCSSPAGSTSSACSAPALGSPPRPLAARKKTAVILRNTPPSSGSQKKPLLPRAEPRTALQIESTKKKGSSPRNSGRGNSNRGTFSYIN